MLCVTGVTTLSWFMNIGLSEVQHRGFYCDVNSCFDRKYVEAFYCGNLYKEEILQ
jgi:hypothetical protein